MPGRCPGARRVAMRSILRRAALAHADRGGGGPRAQSRRRRPARASDGRAASGRVVERGRGSRRRRRCRSRRRGCGAGCVSGARVIALPVSASRELGVGPPPQIDEPRRVERRPRLPLRLARHQRRLVPRADVLADVAAVDVAAERRRHARRGSPSSARSSGTTGSAARRARTARRWRRSGRRRGTACRCRTDRSPARSGSSGRLQRIVDRNSHEPSLGLITQVFLPIQPRPACCA